MSDSLDPDQARQFVGPDLGPNCLTQGGKELRNFSLLIIQNFVLDKRVFISFLISPYEVDKHLLGIHWQHHIDMLSISTTTYFFMKITFVQ